MNVGEYVRTKTGIHKVFKINENATVWKYYCDKKPTGEWDSSYEYIKIKDDDIIKSSPNIIDLIQEGDILKVNDFKDVYTIYEVEMFRNPYTNEKYLGIRNDIGKKPKRLYEIPLVNLSIITKEQYESMEYKVGE